MSFKSIREMCQMGRNLAEIAWKGEDYRKHYRTRPKMTFTIKNIDERIGTREIISQKTYPMKSHVKGLMAYIYTQHTNTLFTGVYDINKTISNTVLGGYSVDLAATVSDAGIIVGTSSVAVLLTDHFLNTQILNGTTPGRLMYRSTTFSALTSPSAGKFNFSFDRDFENLSGTDVGGGVPVTIRETGFVIGGVSGAKFLAERTSTFNSTVDNDIGSPTFQHQEANVAYTEEVEV